MARPGAATANGCCIEANPGTLVQRYAITYQDFLIFEPHTWCSWAVSGFYFTRIYEDWDEGRVGGNLKLGLRLHARFHRPLSACDGERVNIYNPHVHHAAAIGRGPGAERSLRGFDVGMAHDTRDSPFLPTQGHLLSLDFEAGRRHVHLSAFQRQSAAILLAAPAGRPIGAAHVGNRRHIGHYRARIRRFTTTTSPAVSARCVVGHSAGLAPQVNKTSRSAANSWPSAPASICSRSPPTMPCEAWCSSISARWSGPLPSTPTSSARPPASACTITLPAMGPAPIAVDLAFPVASTPATRFRTSASAWASPGKSQRHNCVCFAGAVVGALMIKTKTTSRKRMMSKKKSKSMTWV